MSWLKKNELFIAVFVLSTLFFVVQHARNDSWDFHAYVLNAEYLFHDGGYFEPLRPPLMQFIIGMLGFVSRTFAEYGYIVLVSALFAFGMFRLARAVRVNASSLYALTCTFYVLMVGLTDGTELLALGFLALFAAALIENRFAGHWLALLALSRYTGFSLVPLLVLRGKAAWKDVLVFVLLSFPWLLFNYLTYGNWFASIADQYANNIVFRDYIHTPISPRHFLYVANLLLPFAVLGFGRRALECVHRVRKRDIVFFSIALITVLGYVNIPIKSSRYLFALALPIAVWAFEGIEGLSLTWSRRCIKGACAVLFSIGLLVAFHGIRDDAKNGPIYEAAIQEVREQGDCSVMSNGWVELSYYGLVAQDFPRKELVNDSIDQGELIVLFPHIGEPDYARDEEFLANLPLIAKKPKYTILGSGCNPPRKNDALFVKKLADTIERIHGYRTEERPCRLLSKDVVVQGLCDLMNPKPFETQQVRIV